MHVINHGETRQMRFLGGGTMQLQSLGVELRIFDGICYSQIEALSAKRAGKLEGRNGSSAESGEAVLDKASALKSPSILA